MSAGEAPDEFDYDDLISQNILIKKDEPKNNSCTVEVVTKQSEDYESQYNKQAAQYQMDSNIQTYLQTVIDEDEGEWEEDGSSTGSDYEVVPTKVIQAPISDQEDDESSDSDWEVTKKRSRQSRSNFECDECGKRCLSKRGLDMHKRSHERQRTREQQANLNVNDG